MPRMPRKKSPKSTSVVKVVEPARTNLRQLTSLTPRPPQRPIRETYTLIPGVKVTVVAAPALWPCVKKDGAYVSIDAAPAEPNATRDAAQSQPSGRNRRSQPERGSSSVSGSGSVGGSGGDGDPTIPGATVTEFLPGDDDAADRMAASMDLSPESQRFLRQAERSILRKEEL